MVALPLLATQQGGRGMDDGRKILSRNRPPKMIFKKNYFLPETLVNVVKLDCFVLSR